MISKRRANVVPLSRPLLGVWKVAVPEATVSPDPGSSRPQRPQKRVPSGFSF
jgi:hypothetical protein